MDQAGRENQKQAGGNLRAIVDLYFDMTRGSRLLFVSALVLLALSMLSYLGFAVAVGKLVDGAIRDIVDGSTPDGWISAWGINQWALILFGLVLINMVCSYFDICWFQMIGERATAELRTRLLERLVYLPMGFFSENRTGDLASRILADAALLQEGWINDVRNGISYIAMATGSIVMLFAISPSLSIFIFLIGLPVIAVSVWSGKKIGENAKLVQKQLGQTSVISEEAIHGIHRVKTFANEEYENRRFKNAVAEYLTLSIRVAKHRAGLFSGVLFILMSSSVFLMWYGSHQIQEGRLSPGDFTSFMFFLGFLGNAGGSMAQLAGRAHRMAGAAQRVNDLLNETPEESADEETSSSRMTGDIEFCDVSFSYPGRDQVPALKGINLHLKAGQCAAVVGPSGSGKTTLTALLFRLFEPGQGALKIDGKNAQELSLKWLRSQMAIVPQEVLLFGGTVKENIAYGRPEATQEEIFEAASQANVMEFIEQLPDGLDTIAGDRGLQFSGGQQQRIAIARAILRNPAVLVLDEAASSLDAKSERLVRDALEGLIQKRTTLVIAHRLHTIREADIIIVMKEGNIVEQGTHEELYDANGFYRELCDEQQWGDDSLQ